MLLSKDQVIRFRGSDGLRRAADFARELCGRGEQIGNTVRIKHRTHLKPNLAAEFSQLSLEPGVLDTNGHAEAARA
jgi:hypothetical protein